MSLLIVLASLLCLASPASGRLVRGKRRQAGLQVAAGSEENPLVACLGDTFPPFDRIRASHVVPAIKLHLRKAETDLRALEEAVQKPDFTLDEQSLLSPHRRLGENLHRAFGIASHLKSLGDSPELRAAIEAVQPMIVQFGTETSQSKPLYVAFKALRKDKTGFAKLTGAQRRLVELELQGFELSGIGLEGKQHEEFNNITQRLSLLGESYSENVLDSTKSWKKVVQTREALRGVPEASLRLAAEGARREKNMSLDAIGKDGLSQPPFLLTMDGPCVSAVLTYAEDPDVRKEVYLASIGRASDLAGPDNTPVLRETLELRQRHAELLGFRNYVELSMQTTMAKKDEANEFLEELRTIAYPKAQDNFKDLQAFVKQEHSGDLKHWDLSFWSHKQVEAQYDIDPEKLRPYFPLERVLSGMFSHAGAMFGIKVVLADGPKWHKDVSLFEIRRGDSPNATGYLFFDLFARPAEKRPGAWQVGVTDYDREEGRKAVAAIVCNFRQAAEGQPALLSFGEVHTLFHEFGHALQTTLTTQDEPSLAGTSGVEWDAVELSSQFMEYWLDETNMVVNKMAGHYKTGEALPLETLSKLKQATKYHVGMGMLSQLHLSILDLDLHTKPLGKYESPHDREVAVASRRKTKLLTSLPQDRFLNHFSHIFAGGYAAKYYSYKWAEVLSADAFSRFEEMGATKEHSAGQTKLRQIGAEYANTVLAEGGGRKAADIFKSFRQRAPSTKALLRYTFGSSAMASL